MSNRIPYWWASPEAWDTLVLAGAPMPGVARVAVARTRRVEVKGARGQDGADYTLTGYDPAEITISLTIHTEAQFEEAVNLLDAIGPGVATAKKAKSLAVDIAHPCTQIGAPISAMIIESIDYDMPNNGIYVVNIKGKEFLPSKKSKIVSPKGAKQAKKDAANAGYAPKELVINGVRTGYPDLTSPLLDS